MKKHYLRPESDLIQVQVEGCFLSSGNGEDLQTIKENSNLTEDEFWNN